MELSDEEIRCMKEERERYRTLIAKACDPKPCPVQEGVEITCIGNAGGADNQVHGRPCGGFLLRAHCRTILVDPGNNSIAEIVRLGLDPYEITDVLASHAHSDHVGDLTTAVSAALGLGLVEKTDAHLVVTPSLIDYNSALSTRFGYTLPTFAWQGKVTPLFASDLEVETYDGRIIQSQRTTGIGEHICISSKEARHGQIAVSGFLIETGFGRIGYTSDTEYFEDLPRQFQGCDLLWMNMNTLGLDAIDDAAKAASDPSAPVNNHLGYVGVCMMIEEVRPSIVVVSHFGTQLIDYREEVEAMLRRRFSRDGIAIYCAGNGDSWHFDGRQFHTPQAGVHGP